MISIGINEVGPKAPMLPFTPNQVGSATCVDYWIGNKGVTLDGSSNLESWAGQNGAYTMTTPGTSGPTAETKGAGTAWNVQGTDGTTQKRLDLSLVSTAQSYTFVFGADVKLTSQAGNANFYTSATGFLACYPDNSLGKIGFKYGVTSRDIANSVTGDQTLIYVLNATTSTGTVYRNGVSLGSATYAGTNLGQAPDTRGFLGFYLDLKHAQASYWKIAFLTGAASAADVARLHTWASTYT